MKYVSWSGGFDSTYIVLQHVMNGETVQPFTLLWDQPNLLSRIKKTQDFFINLYPNNILKPEIFDSKDLQEKVNSSEILTCLNNYEEKALKEHEVIFQEIYGDRDFNIYFLKDSNGNKYKALLSDKDRFDILLKYYWPVFHTDNKIVSSNNGIEHYYSTFVHLFQKFLFFTNVYLSNFFQVDIDIGIHAGSFCCTEPMKKWIGIDENFKIKSQKYPELEVLKNIRLPLAFKSKKDMTDDLFDNNIELLKLMIENCCSCLSTKNVDKNYCNTCPSCLSLRSTKVFYKLNLYKINKKNYKLPISRV